MRKTYKLHHKLLKVLLKENLIFIIGMIIITLTLQYFKSSGDLAFDILFLKILVGIVFVFNLPAILLLINYYYHNKELTLYIDKESDVIQINKKGISTKHKLSDIESSIYNVGIYYKNKIDRNGRWSAMHSDFGYWDLKFENGDRYYISNLLIDFLHEHAFIKKTKYRFRFFPFIDKSESKIGITLKQKRTKEKTLTEKFIGQFKSKNEKQLLEIINNKNSYQKEAVKAATIILKNKNVG
ncbi:hypothetical protein [Winogradskyella helgolandensis]|uniref:hypothetical protein n=1 Tax=Winogradskyella helgolandensis TaxID=2697010 RepID=UPI0015B846B3|nr:hypothetical protein [Winogradskyella helgolandensis]